MLRVHRFLLLSDHLFCLNHWLILCYLINWLEKWKTIIFREWPNILLTDTLIKDGNLTVFIPNMSSYLKHLLQITPASLWWLHVIFLKEQVIMSVSFPRQSTLPILFGPLPIPNSAFETAMPYLLKKNLDKQHVFTSIVFILIFCEVITII